MSNKKLSRRAEKPRLSRWRQRGKAKDLGGEYPPRDFCHLVVVLGAGLRQSFLSFSFSGFRSLSDLSIHPSLV